MMTALTITPPTSGLDHALRYVSVDGLALCLLHPASKRPMMTAWNDPARVLRTPEAVLAIDWSLHGMGVVHEPSHTATLDVDHLDACRVLFAEYGFDYDAWMSAFPRIRTREGKDKILFRLPSGFVPGANGLVTKLALRWPDPTGECDARGNRKVITVLELRGGDNQDVLPPSIHPDTRQPYAWARAPWEFESGIPTMPADHPLLVIWAQWDRFRSQLEAVCPWADPSTKPPVPTVQVLAPTKHGDIIGQYNRSISCAEILERNGYQKRGKRWLAPHSSTKIPGVVPLEGGKIYSHHGSDVLGNGHAHDAFSLLTVLECSQSIHLAMEAATRELGVVSRPEPRSTGIDFDAIVKNSRQPSSTPITAPPLKRPVFAPQDHLLTIPGRLGEGVEWMLDNAKKPQPIYAVQAMLALGATVLGRRFCTDHQNWPSLFLPVLGLSATGKEAIKQSIEQILTASGLESLIGPNKYTSDSGLMSSLIHQPSHICVSDEFGKILESASDPNNTGARSTLRMMMEVWGRCDGVLRPTGYATAGLRQDAIDALNARFVYKPALTFVGLATPDSFYEALTSGSLIDGFINRMLIVECTDERKPSVFRHQTPPPERLISWCKSAAPTGFIVNGEFQSIDNAANREPSSVTVIPFSREAMAKIIDFDAYCIQQMNALQSDGLAEMYGRTNEIAMRVALIVAVSCEAPTIALEHVEWAVQYVSYWTAETIKQARARVADGACDAAMKDVERLLVRAGDAGLSLREIRQRSRRFARLAPRAQLEVMSMLKQDHMIDQRRVATSTKPKDVWFYVGDA